MTTMMKKIICIANNVISKPQSSRWAWAKKIGLLITDWTGLYTPFKQLAIGEGKEYQFSVSTII